MRILDPDTKPAHSIPQKQSSQPGAIRLTAEGIVEVADGPTLQEVMAHFGYDTIEIGRASCRERVWLKV